MQFHRPSAERDHSHGTDYSIRGSSALVPAVGFTCKHQVPCRGSDLGHLGLRHLGLEKDKNSKGGKMTLKKLRKHNNNNSKPLKSLLPV